MDASLIVVDFERLADPAERDFFHSVPTTLSLPDAAVDRLIAVGRELLRESAEYQSLIESLKPPARD